MKHSLRCLLILALSFAGCTTAQLATSRAIDDPLVSAAVAGYAQTYGVPPVISQGVTGVIQNEFWSYLNQANHQQPITQGASIPAVGSAVSQAVTAQKAANPGVSTTALLTNALSSLGATK